MPYYNKEKLILLNSYNTGLENAEYFSKEEVLNIIVSKIDFNKPLLDDAIAERIKKIPFTNKEMLVELVKDGELSIKRFEVFLNIVQKYIAYISALIPLFDKSELTLPFRNDLIELIKRVNIKEK